MRRRGRNLTEEEQAIWSAVAATTERRAPTPPRVDEAPPAPPPAPELRISETSAGALETGRVLKPVGGPAPRVTLPAAPPPAHSGLDRATETRLRKGRRDPDARLDLHGMTATRAHTALIGFISRSRAAGCRLVLVITGKGGPDGWSDRRPFGDSGPGVLRREAPVWLSTPPLSGMVVNVSRAHPRHGGDGALYVYLKRPRR